MKYHEYQAEDLAADESFQNYFLEQNEEAMRFWKDWIEKNPERFVEVEGAKKLLQSVSVHVSSQEISAAKDELKQRMFTPKRKGNYPRKRKWAASIIGMAALFLGLIVVAFYFQTQHSPEWTTIRTDYGQLNEVELPDGSYIFLNSNSTIKFDNNWTNQLDREVWLDGEAYFDVEKNPTKGSSKFLVHSNRVDVAVLGTKFNVYNRNEVVEVALESGKVELQIKRAGKKLHYEMKPNDVILLSAENKISRTNETDINLFTSWKEHELKLKKTPITKVVNALSDNFGYEVTVKNNDISSRTILNDVFKRIFFCYFSLKNNSRP